MKTIEAHSSLLRGIRKLLGASIEASDGAIGRCHDFLFDDQRWTLRYLVADTRKWLPGRKVLISPHNFGAQEPGDDPGRFQVSLTKDQIKHAPPLDTDAPVSRRYELEMARHFNYQPYWSGGELWGGAYLPGPLSYPAVSPEEWDRRAHEIDEIDRQHLRSCEELIGYAVSAGDGEIGTVHDFVVETGPWTMRWLVVDAGSSPADRKVILSPGWIAAVSWNDAEVSVDIPKAMVATAPEFDPDGPVDRNYETRIFAHYGRPDYWSP